MTALSQALTRHQESLRSLDLSHYQFRFFHNHEDTQHRIDLTQLTALQELTIKTHKDSAVSDHLLLSQLPRSLRRLRIYEFPYESLGAAVALAGYFLTRQESAEPKPQSLTMMIPNLGNQNLPNLEELSIAYWPLDEIHSERQFLESTGKNYLEENNWRFKVYRITPMRGAVPPYLWDEHIPSFVKVYDNTSNKDLWNSKSEFEIAQQKLESPDYVQEQEMKRQQREVNVPLRATDESDEPSWGVSPDTPSPEPNVVPFPGWPTNTLSAGDPSVQAQHQHVVVPPPYHHQWA